MYSTSCQSRIWTFSTSGGDCGFGPRCKFFWAPQQGRTVKGKITQTKQTVSYKRCPLARKCRQHNKSLPNYILYYEERQRYMLLWHPAPLFRRPDLGILYRLTPTCLSHWFLYCSSSLDKLYVLFQGCIQVWRNKHCLLSKGYTIWEIPWAVCWWWEGLWVHQTPGNRWWARCKCLKQDNDEKTELQYCNVHLWYFWIPSMGYTVLKGWHGDKLLSSKNCTITWWLKAVIIYVAAQGTTV